MLLAYGAHIIFEYLGWRLVQVPIRFRTLCGIALIGAGITNAVGQYWLSGSAIRLRLYRQAEVPLGPMVQVTAFVVSSIWIGYLLVAGVLTMWLPTARRLMVPQACPASRPGRRIARSRSGSATFGRGLRKWKPDAR